VHARLVSCRPLRSGLARPAPARLRAPGGRVDRLRGLGRRPVPASGGRGQARGPGVRRAAGDPRVRRHPLPGHGSTQRPATERVGLAGRRLRAGGCSLAGGRAVVDPGTAAAGRVLHRGARVGGTARRDWRAGAGLLPWAAPRARIGRAPGRRPAALGRDLLRARAGARRRRRAAGRHRVGRPARPDRRAGGPGRPSRAAPSPRCLGAGGLRGGRRRRGLPRLGQRQRADPRPRLDHRPAVGARRLSDRRLPSPRPPTPSTAARAGGCSSASSCP